MTSRPAQDSLTDLKTRQKNIETLGKRNGSAIAVQMSGSLASSAENTELLLGNWSVEALAKALSKGDWVHISAAAIALGWTREVDALTPLLEAATSEKRNVWAIPAIAEALGLLGNAKAAVTLRSLLDEAKVDLKRHKETALRELPESGVREINNSIRNDKLIIEVAQRSLAQLGSPVN